MYIYYLTIYDLRFIYDGIYLQFISSAKDVND